MEMPAGLRDVSLRRPRNGFRFVRQVTREEKRQSTDISLLPHAQLPFTLSSTLARGDKVLRAGRKYV